MRLFDCQLWHTAPRISAATQNVTGGEASLWLTLLSLFACVFGRTRCAPDWVVQAIEALRKTFRPGRDPFFEMHATWYVLLGVMAILRMSVDHPNPTDSAFTVSMYVLLAGEFLILSLIAALLALPLHAASTQSSIFVLIQTPALISRSTEFQPHLPVTTPAPVPLRI